MTLSFRILSSAQRHSDLHITGEKLGAFVGVFAEAVEMQISDML
jgi:hypothetical protein